VPLAGATDARATTGCDPVDDTEAVPVACDDEGGTTLAGAEPVLLDDP
jgi:hypothetical protein